MWLWVGFCLASAVIAEHGILAVETSNLLLPKKIQCEDVLLKTWTIFSNLLDNDGSTVKIPNRNDIIYALTLIKKSILNNGNSDIDNIYLKERLFLREAELAKYKGIYLNDNRPLQILLDQELNPDGNLYGKSEYGVRTNNPTCKEAIKNIINKAYEDRNNLEKSPFCIEVPVNVYNPGYSNPITYTTSNQDQINSAMVQNPPIPVNMAPNPLGQELELPTDNTKKILHAVKLSKKTNHLLGNDLTADLEHAKAVADKINKLYQSSNAYEYSLVPSKPLRNLNSNYVAVSAGAVDNPSVDTFYPKPAVIQESYVAQTNLNTNSNDGKDRDMTQENAYLYNAPMQSMQDNIVNQSYTLIQDTLQSQPGFTNTQQENTNDFVNSKWHPNPAHFGEAITVESNNDLSIPNKRYAETPKVPEVVYNINKYPSQINKVQLPLSRPQNIAGLSDLIPPKTYIPQRPLPYMNRINYVKTFINPYNPKRLNLQNKAYKLTQGRPFLLNYYQTNKYYPLATSLRPGNALQYGKYFQVPGIKPQNGVISMQKLSNQYYPNRVVHQKLMQKVVPQYQGYNVNLLNKPSQSYAYGTKYLPPTQNSLNYYNDQSIIDKLANSISGTNFVKLDSNGDSEAEVELTYRVNRPPLNEPEVFYVKFRMPYQQFAQYLNEFLNLKNSRSASPDIELYENLASQYNATVIPTGTKEISEEDIKSPEGKILVGARYINPNGNDNSNSLDLLNLSLKGDQNNANIQNPDNYDGINAQIPLQAVQ